MANPPHNSQSSTSQTPEYLIPKADDLPTERSYYTSVYLIDQDL